MQHGFSPTMGAIGGTCECCYDGPSQVLVGSGDRRPSRRRRASSARGPSPTSFGVVGLTRARQSILARQQGRLARRRQDWSRAFLWCGPHTPPSISRMRARSRHTGVASMAAREADGRREQLRERVSAGCVRPDGGGAGGGSSEAGRAYEGDGRDGVMGCARASTGCSTTGGG